MNNRQSISSSILKNSVSVNSPPRKLCVLFVSAVNSLRLKGSQQSRRDRRGCAERRKVLFQLAAKAISILVLGAVITIASTHLRADTGTCSGQMITLPFTDVVGSIFFCSIAEAYFSALTNGTDATHYSPTANVTRDQMAAFITRTQDSVLRRGSRRAALNQWRQGRFASGAMTDIGAGPILVQSDGEDLWTASIDGSVSRVHASDGRLLGTWTGATTAAGVLVFRGRIFITGSTSPGSLYRIDPKDPPGSVNVVSNSLGNVPIGITADDTFMWTANNGGSVSKINPVGPVVTTHASGFNEPWGILYDGSNVWVTDKADNTLKRLNPDGSVSQSILVGAGPLFATFDGTNIWVPCSNANSVLVVRVKDSQGNPLTTAFVLASLTGNGLSLPQVAAFDGERVLITNQTGSISLWKATDLAPIGSFSAPQDSQPYGACSDGVNFWISLFSTGKLARF
jgi:hypothetical protein